MRKVGDVMKDLGFNKDSSVETQKAFVKHLIKAAYGVEVREHKDVIPLDVTKVAANPQAKRPTKQGGEQLSFDFDQSDKREKIS